MYIYVNQNSYIESEQELIEDDSIQLGYRFADIYYLNAYILLNEKQIKKFNKIKDKKDVNYMTLFPEYAEEKMYYYLIPNEREPIAMLYGLCKQYKIAHIIDEYIDGAWFELTDEHYKFYQENPLASHQEIINMQLNEPVVYEPSLETLKTQKIWELQVFDKSEEVNSFSINGINAWFTVEERNNYAQSIQAAKILKQDTLVFFIDTVELSIPTEMAEQLLAAIQLYADAAYIVTKKHQIAIKALETKEDVANYNFKEGYPEKLKFEL